jgi:2-oxoglutarate dehydrogenase E1 component
MAAGDQREPGDERTARLARLYSDFRRDPASVSETWREAFGQLDPQARTWLESLTDDAAPSPLPPVPAPSHSGELPGDARAAAMDSMRALMLIRAFRVRGHLEAHLDPLGLDTPEPHADLDPASYGFSDADLDRLIFCDGHLGLDTATLGEILRTARSIYCRSVGVEFMHIQDPTQKMWVQNRMEGAIHRIHLKPEGKRELLQSLTAAETFERFLDRKFTGTKRFGLDGGESTMPALEQIVRVGARLGVDDVVIGMPHRGRLNVLANLMSKKLRTILAEFRGGSIRTEEIGGSGDVKYHLGTSVDRTFGDRKLHLSLTPNPSHLEAVNPVVVGKVRAKQDLRGDADRSRCMGILLHGDAAFAGQGLVPETLEFCELEGYRTGGTIHLIVNNQIGFTTSPVKARTGPYCSDVAKANMTPIFHVNGDDPESVVWVAELAAEFRQTFGQDVVIDLFCYRRHGHNEGDEPAFTQPLMYRKIRSHPSTRELYANRLIEEGTLRAEEADAMVTRYLEGCEKEFVASEAVEADQADWLEGTWSGLEPVQGYAAHRGHTEVSPELLQEVGGALTRVPEGFTLNSKVARQLRAKAKMLATGEGIDWGTAEALAFGTLLAEGHRVRLSGEDVNRGTFSHRHASWIDQETEARFVPLNHIRELQESIEIVDSPLSEFGVLGFEYGYAMAEPGALVLWEAQFGDFANGAQVIIDQFITSGESKWLRMSGLVMLLPHGFEGQGPEHSSARLERFLQCCAEDNIQVVNCTTPANYFHVLRRQLHRRFRKPLVVMSPKSLLRHKRVVSRLSDFSTESHFHRILYCDTLPGRPEDARQLVLCSGKVYYDLLEEREKRGITDVHFMRLEQLYPFPSDALAELLTPYRHCHLVWCQEEPRNMGAWGLVSEFINETAIEVACNDPLVRYAGRESSASPATGFAKRHQEEQARLIDDALTVGSQYVGRIGARKEKLRRSRTL